MTAAPPSLLTRTQIARQAVPIILAGASVPLLGMVDTAVIGHYGSAAELGALAVGALLFNFLYWAFGFLRMATTGFVVQAAGGGQAVRLQAAVLRPLLLGLGIGLALWLLHAPLSLLFHAALGSTPALEASSNDYVAARIWGAPAALALYALCGSLIGLGRGGALLAVQLLLNGLNALLDIWFAGWLGMGLRGIGLGTAIAEWTSCALALWLLRQALREHGVDLRPAGGQWLGDRAAWRALWSANGDLLLRTLCLLAGFAWFARQGSQLGEVVLAGNHLLLQLVAFCAFFLDGFAHVTEAHVGRAIGRGDRSGLRRVVRLGGELAAATALGLALLVLLGGAGSSPCLPTWRRWSRMRRPTCRGWRPMCCYRWPRSSSMACSSAPPPLRRCGARRCMHCSRWCCARGRRSRGGAATGCGWRCWCLPWSGRWCCCRPGGCWPRGWGGAVLRSEWPEPR
ncbi:MATE family efflux transporter [Stenotrophomonas koreensis]|uniref:MATE family efflux transporter n=1 Tax=Stenotrophomonas koreensis TaxID=266128 RepID=UPI003399F358